ncbi:DUF2759 domain-containing protein [Ornithinibacillus sp. 4-3]|uniref:DUF2759 domain-containing protein n=1 Tax=Ornithinibacillus sp. 4-3 TaxID=3231488 RepID=A0AB39HGM1_9BACI
MVLAIICLLVALLSVVSVFRQLKYKNLLALVFSGVSALVFGFFSVMTITCNLMPHLGICGA